MEEENNNEVMEEAVETTTETGAEVVEETTEAVEVPDEKTFTQSQLDKIVQERVGRVEKKYAKKYGKLENTLKAGLGTENLDDTTSKLVDFYKEQGVTIPEEPIYSEEDERILASHEAQSIIDLGLEEISQVAEEMNARENLTTREKYMLESLNNKKFELEREKELRTIGVSKEEIESSEFKEFANKFNKDISLKDIYEIYSKTKPEEAVPMGSMQSTTDKEIKKYYSPEDFDRLTEEDLNNPLIWEAVKASKEKWN